MRSVLRDPVRHRSTGLPRKARRSRLAIVGLSVVLPIVLSACGSGYGTSSIPTTAPPSTLRLGPMPPAPPTTAPAPLPEPTVPTTVAGNTVELGRPLEDKLATVAAGNRALLIGDSVLADATPKAGGDLCEAMKQFGWSTSIATQPSADTDFATTALDEAFDPAAGEDYDAVAIFLGNNLGAELDSDEPIDILAALAPIESALTRLAPRPVLLVTVSVAGEHRSARRDFNAALETRYESHPNIAVLDWATISADDPNTVESDGVSLTSDGAIQLGLRYASAFGTAPETAVAGGSADVTCDEIVVDPAG